MNIQYHILFINLLMGIEIISILTIINIVINILEQVFVGTNKHFFHNSCIILHSYQHCMRVPIALQICHTCYFLCIYYGHMKYYFIVVLICISLVTSDIKLLLMCLLAIFIFSLEECLFKSLAHLKIGLLVFLLL